MAVVGINGQVDHELLEAAQVPGRLEDADLARADEPLRFSVLRLHPAEVVVLGLLVRIGDRVSIQPGLLPSQGMVLDLREAAELVLLVSPRDAPGIDVLRLGPAVEALLETDAALDEIVAQGRPRIEVVDVQLPADLGLDLGHEGGEKRRPVHLLEVEGSGNSFPGVHDQHL